MSIVGKALELLQTLLNQQRVGDEDTLEMQNEAGRPTSASRDPNKSGSLSHQELLADPASPKLRQTLSGTSFNEDPMQEAKELSHALHDVLGSLLTHHSEKVYREVQLSQPRQIAEPAFQIPNVTRLPGKNSYYRWRASTPSLSLTVRASEGLVELYVIPTDDVPLRSISEYGSRLKGRFELSRRRQEEFVWTLNKRKVGSEEAIGIMQQCLDELVGKSESSLTKPEPQAFDRAQANDPVQQFLLEKQNLIFKMLNEQEVLKTELARTLHDTVLADLLMLKRHLRGDQELQKEEIIETIDEIAQQLREVCNECAPRNLHDWGLKTSLQDLLQRMEQRTGIKCVLKCDLEIPNMPANVELHIFRLMQEALNNVEKHAGAKRIDITVEKVREKTLRFSVIDNGKGFVPGAAKEKSTDSGGMGVSGMKERAELIRVYFPVKFGVKSAPMEGTTLYLEITVQEMD